MDVNTRMWFAAETRPRYEKKVAVELENKEVETFLPLVASPRQWSDRRCTVQLPLFQNYVFVRIAETSTQRIAVLRTHGVKGFVGVRGIGVPIPESEIESVRTLLAQGVSLEVHPFLNLGQRVRICGGSLGGVQGILLERHNDRSLVISIHLIQRSLAIRLAGYQVEAA